jgi:exosortase/archaeosortase family protein
MKLSTIQLLSIILLIGSFLYLFEILYHGFEIEDINQVQILLTFSVLILSSGFLFGYQMLEKKIKKKTLLEMMSFFALTVAFLFLVFYPRTFNQTISLVFAVIYFIAASVLLIKRDLIRKFRKNIDFGHPWIRFSYRFFIILGILIFPASVYQYFTSGNFDFTLSSIYMPMIDMIMALIQPILSLIGINTVATASEGGYTLAVVDNSYQVFVGALCSGVTSMMVFIAVFMAMMWDVKASMKKRLVMFAIGIFGTLFSNVLRVLTLFLVGFYYGVDALMAVHTHLGWMLYFIWITVFWVVAFRFIER